MRRFRPGRTTHHAERRRRQRPHLLRWPARRPRRPVPGHCPYVRARPIAAVSVPTANRPAPKPIMIAPSRNNGGRLQRRHHRDQRKGRDPDQRAIAGQAVGIHAIGQAARRPCERGQRAAGQQGRQHRGGRHRQAKNFAAEGFQQDILHGEAGSAQRHGHQQAHGLGLRRQGPPGVTKTAAAAGLSR